jgi:hypothetical protein
MEIMSHLHIYVPIALLKILECQIICLLFFLTFTRSTYRMRITVQVTIECGSGSETFFVALVLIPVTFLSCH